MKLSKLSIVMSLALSCGFSSMVKAGLCDVLGTGDPDQIKRYCLRESKRAETEQPLRNSYTQLADIYTGGTYFEFLGTPVLDELTQTIIDAEEARKKGSPAALVSKGGATALTQITSDEQLALAFQKEEFAGAKGGTADAEAARDCEFARALQEEENQHARGGASAARQDDFELARQLQAEEDSRTSTKGAVSRVTVPVITEAERKAAADMTLLSDLVSPERLPFGMNVHTLDSRVGHYLPHTLASMQALNLGDDTLGYQQMAKQMSDFYGENGVNLLVSSTSGAQPTPLAKQTLQGFIPRIFRADFLRLGNDFRKMLSRAWSQARRDYEQGDIQGVTHMAIAIAENFLGGGTDCLAGRRNRMLVAAMRIGGLKAEKINP